MTIAEEFILVTLPYNDKSTTSTILVLIPERLVSASTPLFFNDVQCWLETLVDKIVCQAVIWSAVNLNNPERWFSWQVC